MYAALFQAAEPVTAPQPTSSPITGWLDKNLTPAVNWLGAHPYFFAGLIGFILWMIFGTSVILALRLKYKDRSTAPFNVLIIWNIFEITCGNVWRLQKHYWPTLPVNGLGSDEVPLPERPHGHLDQRTE